MTNSEHLDVVRDPDALRPDTQRQRANDYMERYLGKLHREKYEHVSQRYNCQLEVVIPARVVPAELSDGATILGLPVVVEEATVEGQEPFVRCRCER